MTKPLTDRQGATETMASAAETHAALAGQKLSDVLSPYLEGKEKMPDVALMMRLFARRQRAMTEGARGADDAYEKELGDDAEPRRRRDAAAAQLAIEIGEIRDTIASTFGPDLVKALGLEGRVDPEPKAVLDRAKRLAEALSDAKRVWPKPKRKGIKVDPAEWAADLKAPIAALEPALADVAREAREAQAASDARNKALAANDDSFARIAGAVSALLRVAGEDALAARVRPSGRRPGQVAGEDEGGASPEATPKPEGG